MNVVIIGTGNVATVFGRLFKKAGYTIKQVFGRSLPKASMLAEELDTVACAEWGQIDKEADIYLLAIADTALYDVDQHLVLLHQLVLHTAGSVSKDVLKKISLNYGVLYPLQSLRKELPVRATMPLLIDANNAQAKETVRGIAHRLSSSVTDADDKTRLHLHLAAIFINNFTNHLYAVTEDLCKKEGVDFKLLLPLATETVKRLGWISPSQAATGPAIRKDEITINKHLDLLKSHPHIQKLYRLITESIMEVSKG